MKLKNLADNAVTEVGKIIPGQLSESEVAAISEIIENTLVEAVGETSEHFSETAVICCGPEADLAHKIAEEMGLAQKALIANLMGER
jgi:hypothetical protein